MGFIKNTYIRIASNIIEIIFSLIISILIIKYFGIKLVGTISYYTGIIGLLGLMSDFGLSIGYGKYVAEDNKKINIFLPTFFFIKIILIISFIVFTCIFINVAGKIIDDKLLFYLIFAGITASFVSSIAVSTISSLRRFKYLSITQIICKIITTIILFISCIFLKNKNIIASQLLMYHSLILMFFINFIIKEKLNIFGFNKEIARKLICYVIPIFLNQLFSNIIKYLDRIFIKKYIGISELGFYTIAKNFYNKSDIIIKPISYTLFYELTYKLKNYSKKKFQQFFAQVLKTLNFFAAVVTLIMIFYSNFFVRILFGIENIRISFILKFFSLMIVARLLFAPFFHIAYAKSKIKLFPLFSVINICMLVLAYYLLLKMEFFSLYLGSSVIPIIEFFIYIFPTGLYLFYITKKEIGKSFLFQIIIKIYLPLIVFISLYLIVNHETIYFFITSFFLIIVFFIIEIKMKIINKEITKKLTHPFIEIFQKGKI